MNDEQHINLNEHWQTRYDGFIKNIPEKYKDRDIESMYISAYPAFVVNIK